MQSRYPFILFCLLSTTYSKEDMFVCEDGPLGEMSMKLHRSHHDQAAWFKDVIFPVEVEKGSLEAITNTLRPAFERLCESEDTDVNWSVKDCTDDILDQVIIYIHKKCSFEKEFPPITVETSLSENNAIAKWNVYESELKRITSIAKGKGSGEGEDFVSTGNSTPRCEAMRRLTKLSMGQAAPLLGALQPSADGEINPAYYRAVSLLKEFTLVDVPSWRDLAYYALANIEHTVGGGRWDPRAYADAFDLHNIGMQRKFGSAGSEREDADRRALTWMLKIFTNPALLLPSQAIKQVETAGSFKPLFGLVGADARVESCAKVTVVTVVSDDNSKLDALRASAKRAKVELVVLVTPTAREEWSNDWKPRTLLQYLRRRAGMHADSLILFVDG